MVLKLAGLIRLKTRIYNMKKLLFLLLIFTVPIFGALNIRKSGKSNDANTAYWSLGSVNSSDSAYFSGDTIGWDSINITTTKAAITMNGFKGGIRLNQSLNVFTSSVLPWSMTTADTVNPSAGSFIYIQYGNSLNLNSVINNIILQNPLNYLQIDAMGTGSITNVNVTGTIKLKTSTFYLTSSVTNKTFYIQLPSITCGTYYHGVFSAGSKFYCAYSGVDTMAAWTANYNASGFYDTLGSTVFCISGNMQVGTKDTIICGTSMIKFTNTTATTFTTNNQLYYDIQNIGTGKTTQSGNLLCKNDLTISSGKWVMPSSGLDSVGRDFTRTTTDSLIRDGNLLKIGRHHVTTGTGVVVNNAAAAIEYVGSGVAHNLTAGTGRMGMLRVLDNGSVTQLSRVWSNLINDSVGGWYNNGYTLMIDSLIKIGDTVYTAAADSIIDSGSVLIKSTSRPNLSGTLSMIGNAAAIITGGGNAKSLGRVHLNKGANGVTTSGVTAYDTLFIDDGTLALGDTAYCNVLVWNSTDSSTLAKPIVVSGKITVAAGAKIGFSGTGKLLMTNCVQATLNGNPVVVTYPAGCSFISGRKHRGLGFNIGLIIGIDQNY